MSQMKSMKSLYAHAYFISLALHSVLAILSIAFAHVLDGAKKAPLIVTVEFKEAKVADVMLPHGPERAERRAKIAAKKISSKPKVETDTRTLESDDDKEPSDIANIVFRPKPLLLNTDEVKIPYPEQARELLIEGIVKLELTVSEQGRVTDVKILSGPFHGLRNAALAFARKLFFLPATDEHGQARTAKVAHEVVFRLNKNS